MKGSGRNRYEAEGRDGKDLQGYLEIFDQAYEGVEDAEK